MEVGWVKWLRVGAEGRVRDFLLNYGAGVGGGGQPGAAIGPVRLQQRDKTQGRDGHVTHTSLTVELA